MKPVQRRIAEHILFTDQYQLTMAQLYYRNGLAARHAAFEYFFRDYPDYGAHQAGYCVNAGLEWLLDWMFESRFTADDIGCLRVQKGLAGSPLFAADFLEWLEKNGSFETMSISAIPEGRIVHPGVPLAVVTGPLVMAQILETPLLNILNYQTLIATKASRVKQAGLGRPLLEFGLRRAQDKGANAGARAAIIGGADYTSNVGISHVLGYPPKGTHAHSMVQAFMALGEGELSAFRAYADVYPDDCLLLVDTINTLESGIPNAIAVFEELRRRGHRPVGIRLDSGDLAYLSIQAAKMLDAAGFPETVIVLSNQLDELVIMQIISQIREEAPRNGVDADRLIGRLVYGVGMRLITSHGHSALDGVYKLVAINDGRAWVPTIKLSETPGKTLTSGMKKAWRIYDTRNRAVADLLSLPEENPAAETELILRHPVDHAKTRTLRNDSISAVESLHVTVLADGKLVYNLPSLAEIQTERQRDLDRLDTGVKRLLNPHTYHVALTTKLWDLKQELIRQARR